MCPHIIMINMIISILLFSCEFFYYADILIVLISVKFLMFYWTFCTFHAISELMVLVTMVEMYRGLKILYLHQFSWCILEPIEISTLNPVAHTNNLASVTNLFCPRKKEPYHLLHAPQVWLPILNELLCQMLLPNLGILCHLLSVHLTCSKYYLH